jgi:hypothetical protein
MNRFDILFEPKGRLRDDADIPPQSQTAVTFKQAQKEKTKSAAHQHGLGLE